MLDICKGPAFIRNWFACPLLKICLLITLTSSWMSSYSFSSHSTLWRIQSALPPSLKNFLQCLPMSCFRTISHSLSTKKFYFLIFITKGGKLPKQWAWSIKIPTQADWEGHHTICAHQHNWTESAFYCFSLPFHNYPALNRLKSSSILSIKTLFFHAASLDFR